MRPRVILLTAGLLLSVTLAGCGDSTDETEPADTAAVDDTDTDDGSTTEPGTTEPGTDDTDAGGEVDLPDGCSLPPYTMTLTLTGEVTAGSETFEVLGAGAFGIPIVPDAEQSMTSEERSAEAATTDLLGYGVYFGDEVIDAGSLGAFDNAPDSPDKIRATLSVYPTGPGPIAVGDVIDGSITELPMVSTVSTIGVNLITGEDPPTLGFAGEPEGSVTVVGLTDSAVCFDVDVVWQISEMAGGPGALTMKGRVAAEYTGRDPFLVLF